MNTRFLTGLVVVIAAASGGYYWYQQHNGTAQVTGQGAPMDFATPVEAAVVKQEPLVRSIVAVGSLLANEKVVIRPEFEGRVEKIHFREGEQVDAGDVLFSLDDSIYRAELEQAEARLALSRSSKRRIEALRSKGLSNEQEADQAVSELAVNQASALLARTRLEKMRVHAPFEGTIGLRSISEGAYVSRGQDLATLVNDDPIKLEFSIPEIYLSEVSVGQAVDVHVDAFSDRRFSGTVYAISPEVDIGGRSFTVRALIDNDEQLLVPGLFAQIELVLETREDALLVPEAALMPAGDEQYVFRIIDGIATRTRVRTGLRKDTWVEILEGLDAGAQVVTAGQMKIMDGGKVQPLPNE